MSRYINADNVLDNFECNGECLNCQFNADPFCYVKGLIASEPTADVEEVKWTPCDEELPEKEVLCCDVFENMLIGYIEADGNSDTGFTAENEHEIMYDCIAWKPLPEPYREIEE